MTSSDFSPTEGDYVTVNGIKIYYEEYGKGWPLILLHGGGSTVRMWDKQIPSYSKYFKVIALDSRGHGKTENPIKELHYKQMADDIALFIDELKISKPIICGWSDGAQIALELAINYSEKIKAIIAGGAMLDVSYSMIASMKDIGILGPNNIDFEKLEETVPSYVNVLKRNHSFVYGEDYWKELMKNLATLWLNSAEFPKDKVKAISIPTLILLGDRDAFIPLSDAITMHNTMQNTELAIIPDGTHEVFANRVNLFNKITIDYLLRQ
ncbi:MAG: alpha/beta hydrolase [Asgard group archaeon]|nr:alpha/beta hydrolase [Asgard group archaeon]